MSLGQYIHIALVGAQYFEHYLSRNRVQTCETLYQLTVIVLLILVASVVSFAKLELFQRHDVASKVFMFYSMLYLKSKLE